MTPKKKQAAAFTSIRVIGKKAQNMIHRAKKSLITDEKKTTKKGLPKSEKQEEIFVTISIKSIVEATFAILAIGIGVFLVFHLRDKILLLVLAMFVATIIDPGVQRMQRIGIPRGIAIIFQYLIAICLILFLIISFIPIIAKQLQDIALNISRDLGPYIANPYVNIPFLPTEVNIQLSNLMKTTLHEISIDQFTSTLQTTGQNLSNVAQESVRLAVSVAGSVLNFVISFVIVLVLAFFMQLEKERIIYWIRGFLPRKFRAYADLKSEAIHTKIGQWMRGELLLMFSIFLLTLIALSIIGIDYALTLAVLAGFCELVPAIGPFIAAIPAILIAGTQEGIVWIPILAGVYYAIQWTENNLLVPLIMKRAVGLSPISILFAMMVGISFPNTIHPVLGIMLAVPATTILALFLEDWREARSKDD